MRVASLKESLVSSHPTLRGSKVYTFTPLTEKGWGLITSRVPTLCPSPYKGLQLPNPLDGGFFFPLPLQEREYGIPYKRLVVGARSLRKSALTSANLTANAYWETLEGGKVDLVEHDRALSDPFLGEDYTSSPFLPFYAGARPKDREYQPTKIKRASLAFDRVQGALRGKLGGEEASGYARAIRLLPKKKRAKDQRGGAARRPARYSGLKIPLSWSKNLDEGLSPLSGPFAISNQTKTPKGPKLPSGVLEFNTTNLSMLAKKKLPQATPYGGGVRIIQTRYKPGLSKWWRLLRLHYCLCWGLPWLRQRRFTNYISQLAHVTGLSFIRMCSSSIGFVVKASFLVSPRTLLGEEAFVNGVYVTNPFFQVYKGDRVSILAPSVPSNHRRQAFTTFLKAPPFRCWEVDGLTRAVSIWAEPSVGELQKFVFKRPVPFLSFRMYNWKYKH